MRFGDKAALSGVSLSVRRGEMCGLLGPNGSGKSTALRIMATLLRPSSGVVRVGGFSVAQHPREVRNRLGVVFQSPGLDEKLTVAENMRFQGYLFGLHGKPLAKRSRMLLDRFALTDRSKERVQTLSGGLKRRLELAKALLHQPEVLLLDEPSTGLDIAARQSFWDTLESLRQENKLTIVLTTHLMDEADHCDQVALLDEGNLVAKDAPQALRKALGEAVTTIETPNPANLARQLESDLGLAAKMVHGGLQIPAGEEAISAKALLARYGENIRAVRVGRPTLADVFLAKTGHTLDSGGEEAGQ